MSDSGGAFPYAASALVGQYRQVPRPHRQDMRLALFVTLNFSRKRLLE
jgi:hypothetical protein